MGNVIVEDANHPDLIDRVAGSNLTDISGHIEKAAYLSSSSDIVAHLVLAHQTQMHNLITLTNYKTRIALYEDPTQRTIEGHLPPFPSAETRKQYEEPAEQLVHYLLFADEAPLTDRIQGTSGFAREFTALGPRDKRGRSLRDFDLHTRIFKYPCSYLIYSESFDSLPAPAKQYVYHRLFEVLTGRDKSDAFARLSDTDRRNVFEILLATKKGLPDEWRQSRPFVQKQATRVLQTAVISEASGATSPSFLHASILQPMQIHLKGNTP